MAKNAKKTAESAARATWNVPDWCAALGLGRSTYYTLTVPPRHIKIGKRHLIVESPEDYARRMAELQETAAAFRPAQ